MTANRHPNGGRTGYQWECKIPEEEGGGFDHDWEWAHDWYGDPDVINGTADIHYRRCRACGAEDNDTPYDGGGSPEDDL